jgi:nucleoid-associated protein YgaU
MDERCNNGHSKSQREGPVLALDASGGSTGNVASGCSLEKNCEQSLKKGGYSMALRHTVRQGDSLWSLAHRYLGNGTKWQEILDEHNRAASRPGPRNGIWPIDDPDLIFVGQTIMIPPR